MEIEIIECCGIHGEIVSAGEAVEVDEATARLLVGMGKARPSIQTQAPVVTNRDPKVEGKA